MVAPPGQRQRQLSSPLVSPSSSPPSDEDDRIAFESCGGVLEDFDDGHVPETFAARRRRGPPPCRKSGAGNTGGEGGDVVDEKLPPGCEGASASSTRCRIVRYPQHTERGGVRVYDRVLPPDVADGIYDATADALTPWGTYVTVAEAEEYLVASSSSSSSSSSSWRRRLRQCDVDDGSETEADRCGGDRVVEKEGKDDEDLTRRRHRLAVAAVAHFLLERATEPPSPDDRRGVIVAADDENDGGSSDRSESTPLYSREQFLTSAHGVAVWALSSTAGSEVRYHVDYAELLRYERNVIVPPLWAGTVQCTRFSADDEGKGGSSKGEGGHCNDGDDGVMRGGDFAVNLGGLDHYAGHGYKGNISGDDRGGWKEPSPSTSSSQSPSSSSSAAAADDLAPHYDPATGWATVPYAFNRGTVHPGHLPHLSTPIVHLPEGKRRVILGLNVFAPDVGEEVSRAPEHSDAFRRRVKLYRSVLPPASLGSECSSDACGGGGGGGGNGKVTTRSGAAGGIDLAAVRRNRGLTKLLVLAKRQRVKDGLRRSQADLTRRVWEALLGDRELSEEGGEGKGWTMGRLMDDLSAERASAGEDAARWPTEMDVQVHVHHMIGTVHRDDNGSAYKLVACRRNSLSGSSEEVEEGNGGGLTPTSTTLRLEALS